MHALIADDHHLFLIGLKFLLENNFDNVKVDHFDNGQNVIEFIENKIPDVIIVDIDMPKKSGLDVCKFVFEKQIDAKIIILTMHKDIEMLRMAFHYGAKGFLVKENTSEELVECIQTVVEGGNYLSKIVRDQANTLFSNQQISNKITKEIQSLTQTELKTLKLVSKNYSSKDIAELLFISVKSVDNNRSRICKKLNLDPKKNSLLMWVMENKHIIDNIDEIN